MKKLLGLLLCVGLALTLSLGATGCSKKKTDEKKAEVKKGEEKKAPIEEKKGEEKKGEEKKGEEKKGEEKKAALTPALRLFGVPERDVTAYLVHNELSAIVGRQLT